MAVMRTLLHTHDIHHDPGETLTRASGLFHKLIPSDLFMTGLYVVLGENGRVEWAAGGHHLPLWLNQHGHLHNPDDLTSVGPVLGIDEVSYDTVRWNLAIGDRLLLFTDGLWESRSQESEPFGRERLKSYFVDTLDRDLADVVTGLVACVTAHLQGADFEDDFTILAIERTA